MPNSDFEDRLRRINSAKTAQLGAQSSGRGKMTARYRRLVLGALALLAGGQMIKIANSSYDSIRDQYGIPAAAGMGLGSFALLILGVVLLVGAVLPTLSKGLGVVPLSGPTSVTEPKVRTSAVAHLFFALVGLGLGGLACLFMYVGSAGRQLGITGQVATDTAQAMATGTTIAAVLLAILAILIGLIRHLPMRRVPVFFVLGAMVLFATFQTLRIHPANWPTFMAEFTKSFTNQDAD